MCHVSLQWGMCVGLLTVEVFEELDTLCCIPSHERVHRALGGVRLQITHAVLGGVVRRETCEKGVKDMG